jgi:hypothetical protein
MAEIVYAKSDCISVKAIQETTQLIAYSNSKNFDGLVYPEGSPALVFYIRVPAMFHVEQNEQSQEDLELSNNTIVTLKQKIAEKRLLEVGYMPNYMHTKLQKVLMHELIFIDNTYWKKRDAYESNPIRKYNLKMGQVLLTKYDGVQINAI